MGCLGRATCTVHLISAQDQPGRKPMYHYICNRSQELTVLIYILWRNEQSLSVHLKLWIYHFELVFEVRNILLSVTLIIKSLNTVHIQIRQQDLSYSFTHSISFLALVQAKIEHSVHLAVRKQHVNHFLTSSAKQTTGDKRLLSQ